ncbi:Uncharacterized conserved protein [Phaffia rhodozyma]|uniref:Uncharacterized conserved protein n=1 Tax=Phaffia rhodozyma TaxID=264483 RepID=A0A0F7SM91_PHARH|nr:Uncharacterized conserved protein [Phaffia rhodozyma]
MEEDIGLLSLSELPPPVPPKPHHQDISDSLAMNTKSSLPVHPLSPPRIRTQRALSRSNSIPPRFCRTNRGLSQDLGSVRTDPALDPVLVQTYRANLRRWIEALVIINFDLDIGPVMELSVPERRWGIGVAENIAFSSFPDTSLFTEGQLSWSFKLNDGLGCQASREAAFAPLPNGGGSSIVRDKGEEEKINKEKLDPNGGEGGGQQEGRLFGFVLFLQKRDGTIKRGFFQKSVVILSTLPYPSFFNQLVMHLAPHFFSRGPSVLEAACQEIASWPPPTPSASLSLPFLGSTFNVQLPSPNQSTQLSLGPVARVPSSDSLPSAPSLPVPISGRTMLPHARALRTSGVILASLPSIPPLILLGKILSSIWLIWECLILAEPILIIAPDPKSCSELVWWLRDWIRPLPPSGDLRPYFHIHDASFSLLVNAHSPPAGAVIGATNPYFRQACVNWSNVITLGDKISSYLSKPNTGPIRQASGPNPSSNSARPSPSPIPPKAALVESFQSKRKRQVSKDRILLKKLEAVVAAGDLQNPEANDQIRFHFADLTEKFLQPLNRYFASLIPTDLTPDSSNQLPPLKPFSSASFLSSLRAHGSALSFRKSGLGSTTGSAQSFYDTFLKSKHFGVWLARRCEEARVECEKRARAAGWVSV